MYYIIMLFFTSWRTFIRKDHQSSDRWLTLPFVHTSYSLGRFSLHSFLFRGTKKVVNLWLKFHWSVSYFAATTECWAAGGKYWCRCHSCVSIVSYISKCCLSLSFFCSFLQTFLILTKITWIYLYILSLLV